MLPEGSFLAYVQRGGWLLRLRSPSWCGLSAANLRGVVRYEDDSEPRFIDGRYRGRLRGCTRDAASVTDQHV